MSWSISLSGSPQEVLEELERASGVLETAIEELSGCEDCEDCKVIVNLSGHVYTGYPDAGGSQHGAGVSYSIQYDVSPEEFEQAACRRPRDRRSRKSARPAPRT